MNLDIDTLFNDYLNQLEDDFNQKVTNHRFNLDYVYKFNVTTVKIIFEPIE